MVKTISKPTTKATIESKKETSETLVRMNDGEKTKLNEKKKTKKEKNKNKKHTTEKDDQPYNDGSNKLEEQEPSIVPPVESKSSGRRKRQRSNSIIDSDLDTNDGTNDTTKDNTNDMNDDVVTKDHDSKDDNKEDDRLNKRKQRRLERLAILEKVPKCDENGIAYTKQQIRRMKKRMQNGLHPVETPEEERQRLHREAQLRREEELELAGLLYTNERTNNNNKVDDDGGDENDEKDDDEDNDNNDVDEQDIEDDDKDDNEDEEEDEVIDDDIPNNDDVEKEEEVEDTKETKEETTIKSNHKKINTTTENQHNQTTNPSVTSKRPRHDTKPVPHDYICSACQNQQVPRHWIYDCPLKITKRRGVLDPDARKVFVSGLPFRWSDQDIIQYFTKNITPTTTTNTSTTTSASSSTAGSSNKSHNSNTIISHCKVLKFPDTKRSKGQAYITFRNVDAAAQALKLSGTKLDMAVVSDGKGTKKKQSSTKPSSSSSEPNPTKKLVLSVSKCLNRYDSKLYHHHNNNNNKR